jgi:hypothetical protein
MRSTATIAVVTAVALTLAACGGDDEAAPGSRPATSTAASVVASLPVSTATTGVEPTSASTTTAPTTRPPSTVPETTAPPTTAVDEAWRQQVDAFCSPNWLDVVALPPPSAEPASLEAYAQAHREAWDSSPDLAAIELPPGPGRTPADVAALVAGLQGSLDDAVAGAAAADLAATVDGIDLFRRHLGAVASAFAAAGQTCGPADAEVAAEADLNVTMIAPWQLETGFDSVWVSQDRLQRVARVEPDTGELLATIDMPSAPGKLQPADGRMIVRTADSYVAVDAATNTAVDQLFKSDVGPAANRSWAVDGALWICDGQRLHRYDPATFEPIAVVDLDFECGQPRATSDLAVAFTYNEDPGESGVSRAAFIDSATNSVIVTVDLAADSTVPIVLDDAVFFPPIGGREATVVDRSSWAATPIDLGRPVEGSSQPAFDGKNIYVIAHKPTGTIVVIDPSTYQIVDEIRALATAPSVNSLAATPGVLWAGNNSGGVLQRFDTGA